MNFSISVLNQFKKIYSERFGVHLTNTQAAAEAEKLIELVALLQNAPLMKD